MKCYRCGGDPCTCKDGITIYHGDCLEVLPGLADGSVDVVVTDPPYAGLTGGYVRTEGGVGPRRQRSAAVGDSWRASFDWAKEATRVTSLGVIVFCSYHSICETKAAFNGMRVAALITWHKRNSPPTGKNVPRFTEEYIWCLAASPGLKWDTFTTTLIDVPSASAGCMTTERIVDASGRAVHPTQKPVEVLRRLLSVGGHTILDPFMGSGTTLRAAKDLGRKCIGIEIEEKYCEIAAERLRQGVLF